jgi:methionyl-tRNA formyltransferase
VRVGGAWTTFRGKRLKVLEAEPVTEPVAGHGPGHLVGLDVACGDGALRLVVVQPEGRAPMSAEAWRNGARPAADEELGR